MDESGRAYAILKTAKWRLTGNLMLGTQTSGADVNPFLLAIYHDSGLGNVRHPAPCGMALGVGNIISDHRLFATQLTLQRLLLFD